MPPTAPAHDLARHWTLDPAITFLNQGSFGACPRPVLEAQQALRDRLEREPVLREPAATSALTLDALHDALFRDHAIEVPVLTCPAHPGCLVRISAQAYSEIDDYERLASALRALVESRGPRS